MERILLISEVREKIEERKVKARRHGLCSARKTESHGVKSIVVAVCFSVVEHNCSKSKSERC